MPPAATRSLPSLFSEALGIFALAFGPLAFGCVEPWSLAILETVLFLLLACSALSRDPIPDAASGRIVLPAVLALLALGLLQRLNPSSAASPRVLLPFTVSAGATSRALILWCAYASWLWGFPQALRTPAALRRLAWTLFLIGFVVAVAGLLQGSGPIYGWREWRARSPFGPYYNRNHAASLMSMSSLVGCGLFLSRFASYERKGSLGKPSELIASQAMILLMIATLFCGIMKTGSRGAILSLAFAALVLAVLASVLSRPKGGFWIAGALLLAGGGYAVWRVLHPLWTAFLGGSLDASSYYRLSMYRGAWRMFEDFPAFGVGLGGFASAFPAYQESVIAQIVAHVHSDWLELLLETGLVGFLVCVSGIVVMTFKVFKAWRHCPSREMRCLTGGAMAAALAFMAHGLVDFSFQTPANAVVFLALISWLGSFVAATARPLTVSSETDSRSWRLRSAVLCSFSMAMIVLALLPAAASWRAWQAEYGPPEVQLEALSWAIGLDGRPALMQKSGEACIALAGKNRPSEGIWLRKALEYSSAALEAEPLNPRFRPLQGFLLSKLGRSADSREFASSGL